jgi:hypothetical protein
MIPKSGPRFSEKIMLNKKMERDDDSGKRHLAPEAAPADLPLACVSSTIEGLSSSEGDPP